MKIKGMAADFIVIDDPFSDEDEIMAVEQFPILRFFKYGHLPKHLQEFSKRFSDLAHDVARAAPLGNDIGETEAAIRKILEAKDCAVRSLIRE